MVMKISPQSPRPSTDLDEYVLNGSKPFRCNAASVGLPGDAHQGQRLARQIKFHMCAPALNADPHR